MKDSAQYIGASAAAVLVAAAVAWAGSDGSATLGGWPVFALCVALAFVVQWVAFVPAFLMQTERFFDLTGSVTFLSVIGFGLIARGSFDAGSLALAAMVAIWALRLGFFLSARIRRDGFDRRFTGIKPNAPMFFMTWTLQGLWVSLTAGCALAAIVAVESAPVGRWLAVGGLVWLLGFALEVVADGQKRRFRAEPKNAERFIDQGLWRLCRHPNYLGEIMLWTGIAIASVPALAGWRYATLISPVFVWLLLTRISGIRMLEARADRRWRDDPGYAAYKARTPALFPFRLAGRRGAAA